MRAQKCPSYLGIHVYSVLKCIFILTPSYTAAYTAMLCVLYLLYPVGLNHRLYRLRTNGGPSSPMKLFTSHHLVAVAVSHKSPEVSTLIIASIQPSILNQFPFGVTDFSNLITQTPRSLITHLNTS